MGVSLKSLLVKIGDNSKYPQFKKVNYAKNQSNNCTNDELVQVCELAGDYLNLKSISAYAKEMGLSYNGVKKTRKIVVLFGHKLVIDND